MTYYTDTVNMFHSDLVREHPTSGRLESIVVWCQVCDQPGDYSNCTQFECFRYRCEINGAPAPIKLMAIPKN